MDSLESQTFRDFEVLIIDDGSSDNLCEVLDKWQLENSLKFQYIPKENGGKHTALNVGIHNAQGKFFVILDSDDWLCDGALDRMHQLCKKIENDNSFCGIMARSKNSETDEVIGELFDEEPKISSYIDYHFVLSYKMNINDCFECNKTELLKKYRYPEDKNTKFVSEAWLFDQIRINDKLYCTNDILRCVEYQEDGITNDNSYKERNIVGFLYHYISRIENVLPYVKVPIKIHIVAWWRYWEAVRIDKEKKGPRCKKNKYVGNDG